MGERQPHTIGEQTELFPRDVIRTLQTDYLFDVLKQQGRANQTGDKQAADRYGQEAERMSKILYPGLTTEEERDAREAIERDRRIYRQHEKEYREIYDQYDQAHANERLKK